MAVVAALNSGFDYYSPIAIQNSIDERVEVEKSPLNALQPNTPFEFTVDGSVGENQFLDLANSYFYFQVQIQTAADANPAAAGEVSCVQNLAHSMFQRIEAYLGDKTISDPNALYPYRAYIADLLSRSKEPKDYWMQLQGWWGDDTATFLDILRTTDNDNKNTALKARHKIVGLGQVVELIMRPHLEIFNSDKYLPPGVTLKIRFTPSPSTFALTRGDGQVVNKLLIKDAKFYCVKVKSTHSQGMALYQALREVGPYRINMNRVTLKTVSIAQGQQSADLDNIFTGPIPNRIIFGLVTDAAYNGTFATNPFNFQNFGLNHVALHVNGKTYPASPYSPNFAGNLYKREYRGLIQALNRATTEHTVPITPEQFAGGYTLFAFDLTPDENCDKSHSPQGTGSVMLSLKFTAGLGAAIQVILHAQFDSWIEIDSNYNVLTSF